MQTAASGFTASSQNAARCGRPTRRSTCFPQRHAVGAAHARSGALSPSAAPAQHVLRRGRRSCVVQAAPKKVSAEELEVALADRDVPLIVDFYATWCGPCVLLAKELDRVAEELGDGVRILKIDTDENPQLSTQLQIQGLPTMVFVGTDANKPALRTEGLLPAETIKQIVADELT